MSHEWIFDLNGPGMSPLHRAGMIGLLASLKQLESVGELPEEWKYEVEGNYLRLPNLGTEPEAISALLQTIYHIDEDGLINFPLLRKTPPDYRAHFQQVLLGTFLQHPQSRKAEKKSIIRSYQLGDEQVTFQYLPLRDFQHRTEVNAREISQSIKQGKYIEIKGWAFPGGMVRHNAFAKNTALEDTPERYFLLLCAPLGCLYFRGIAYLPNGDYDPKTQFVLAIPRPSTLEEYVELFLQLYSSDQICRHLYVTGESDAALMSAMLFLLADIAYRMEIDFYQSASRKINFQVMRFGTVGWSIQQKTRTGVINTIAIKPKMIKMYKSIDDKLQPRHRQNREGEQYVEIMPMRNRIAENLIRERPWYADFAEFIVDTRGRRVLYWRKELRELVQTMEWKDESKRRFIDLIQVAVQNRFGRVAAEANQSGADVKSVLDREYERMVLTFSKCRTKENFREELMRFLAVNRAKLKSLSREENIDLLYEMAIENDWKEARDLCLLAIVTYSGKDEELAPSKN